MNTQRIKDVLSNPKIGESIVLNGWVKTARHSKNVSFVELSDGSSFHGIQCVVDKDIPNAEELIKKLNTGASLEVTGELVESPGKGQSCEVHAKAICVIGEADETYPLQKKRHSFEFLREIAHLRPRTNTIGAVLRVRHTLAKAVHDFFDSKGFFNLHTPIITASDCEGAGEMFRVSTLNDKNPPKTEDDQVDYAKDFFGRQAHLTVSGQLEGEIGAMALKNIYTFGPTFRAENSHTSRHLAEFWMVEPEMAFCDIFANMDLAEEFLKFTVKSVLNKNQDDLAFFNKMMDKTLIQTLEAVEKTPFEKITYSEAIDILLKTNHKFEYPVKWGIDLQSEHERFLSEKHFKSPIIVRDYPKEIKAFYMYQNEDQKTVRAMDVLVPKVGELMGGSQREDRYEVLKQSMIASDLNPEEYWWYLDLRKYGSVPHSGFGLGFERLVQYVTSVANIREAIPFPRVPGYAEF